MSATDILRQPDSAPVVIAYDDTDAVTYNGNWTNGITEDFDAPLQIAVYSEGFTLKLGTDVDRSICDVYVDNVFWGSLDTYAATPGELAVTIPLARLGLHVVEIRNRPERNTAAVPVSATSFKLEFKQLETAYNGHAIDYTYDDLSRLLAADYFAAWDDVNPVRDYTFAYDVAGNRTQEILTVDGGTPTQTDYTYDAANRISNAGFAYNDAGQMTADGTLSYSWDRAGRLLGAGDSSYAYNGLGQRVQQTVSGVVTDYLLDVQPGLAKVIAAMTGANTVRFVHERGLLSQQDAAGDWQWMVADGLGSVRGVVDGTGFDPAYSVHYAPYGQSWSEQGTEQTPFGFTGEPTDNNGLVHLRARYYNPALGVFPSLDPVEGTSLNRYAYVAGNVVNFVDLSGMIREYPEAWNKCQESRPCEDISAENFLLRNPGQGPAPIIHDYVDTPDRTLNRYLIPFFQEQLLEIRHRAREAGNDDAARHFIWYFAADGRELPLPVGKMLDELPTWREDVLEILETSLAALYDPHHVSHPRDNPIWESSSVQNTTLSTSCSAYRNNTSWRAVGIGKEGFETARNIYPTVNNDLSIGSPSFQLMYLPGPLGSTNREEFDWFLAMNSFHYYIHEALIVNRNTGEAQVCYEIFVEDHYGWYFDTGTVDQIMGTVEWIGWGNNFPMSGRSGIKCERFNVVSGRNGPPFDDGGVERIRFTLDGILPGDLWPPT